MTRLLDKTYTIEDEEFQAEGRIAAEVRNQLEELKLDTYNNTYVVRVTVDKVDTSNRVYSLTHKGNCSNPLHKE
jgi:hypothetical protein